MIQNNRLRTDSFKCPLCFTVVTQQQCHHKLRYVVVVWDINIEMSTVLCSVVENCVEQIKSRKTIAVIQTFLMF